MTWSFRDGFGGGFVGVSSGAPTIQNIQPNSAEFNPFPACLLSLFSALLHLRRGRAGTDMAGALVRRTLKQKGPLLLC